MTRAFGEEARLICEISGIPRDRWPDRAFGIGTIYFLHAPSTDTVKIGDYPGLDYGIGLPYRLLRQADAGAH